MYHRRRQSLRIFQENMDNPMPARTRKNIWFVFLFLFVMWYILLYGMHWHSFPVFMSLSHQQIDAEEILESNVMEVNNFLETEENTTLVMTNNVDDTQSNTTMQSVKIQEKSKNKSHVQDDGTGNLDILEKEIQPMLEKNYVKESQDSDQGASGKTCIGRYIYIHDLPSRFNDDLVKQCKLLNKWVDMCKYMVNKGLGPDLGNPQRVFSSRGWYETHQFSLEVIFHNRMKQYDCLTNDSSSASAIFVPYYPGLDIARYLWDPYNMSIRDADSLDVAKWLTEKPEWKVMGGRDHFLVAGRITWDFRRGIDEDSSWGNKFMILPESKNMTILTIESSPWNKNDFAIPYPTYFHPSKDVQIVQWQNKMRKQRRRNLFSFAGAPRPNMQTSIRSEIMSQCVMSKQKCKLLECKDSGRKCVKPVYIMKLFQSSIFCLQPPGDSFTRRSTFDSIVAGCIPVFFSPGSAYVQYLWHLPRNFQKYSVLIPENDVKENKVSIEKILSQIPKSRISAMREEVIKLIPKVIYANPSSGLEKFEDAFDLAIKGVTQRVAKLRKDMREWKSTSEDFDEERSWEYFTFGKTEKHEWDHFFVRTAGGWY